MKKEDVLLSKLQRQVVADADERHRLSEEVSSGDEMFYRIKAIVAEEQEQDQLKNPKIKFTTQDKFDVYHYCLNVLRDQVTDEEKAQLLTEFLIERLQDKITAATQSPIESGPVFRRVR